MHLQGAIDASPRVGIRTPSLQGSISLKGGRIDDLVLAQYRETVMPLVSWPSFSLSSTAMRAMLFACRTWGRPQPATTSSTLAGSTPGLRSRSWSMT